jgi:hypothetical protein
MFPGNYVSARFRLERDLLAAIFVIPFDTVSPVKSY